MSERPPSPTEQVPSTSEQQKRDAISLAIELGESHETFPFTGISAEVQAKIKTGQEEMPGYSTPIDELLERFRSEGMKVVVGKFPESGNVMVLPAGSDDILNDSLPFELLQMNDEMDERLRKLLLLKKS
jgi:hypothetical protein